jgi:signal transduction histidine kinase
MGRAITNIVENALYAMPSGGILSLRAREVTVNGDQANAANAASAANAANGRRGVELQIVDTGFGMDDEAARRIFEPYFSTKATGTGLGLSIARRNVELHGGTIAVASQKGVGTTVTLVVPVTRMLEPSGVGFASQ